MAARKKPTAPPSANQANAGETAIGSYKPVDALKHDKGMAPVERPFIPSTEEQGNEADAIAGLPTRKALPLNPVTHRGQDPELYWMNKYGEADDQQQLDVDIRSLYRHEHIAPEKIIANLYRLRGKNDAQQEMFTHELFGNPLAMDELDKPLSYYKQPNKWQNRLIQGDSLLVMTSLLEREGMAGQVQCIYIDPPYGIKYGSNWQMRLNDRGMPSTDSDAALSGEPEVIKAFRDTWELGIHSYLAYLRDRLLVGRELLSGTGSCFVQINDENVHLVRCVLDEVFGSENFVVSIIIKKKSATSQTEPVNDFVLWYTKSYAEAKSTFKRLTIEKNPLAEKSRYKWVEFQDGQRKLTRDCSETELALSGIRFLNDDYPLVSQDESDTRSGPYYLEGDRHPYRPGKGRHWTYDPDSGMKRLERFGRLRPAKDTVRGITYHDDFPREPISNIWEFHGERDPVYVVQTNKAIVERCVLMTTQPGDLVLDPTCGSGTTAFVAEQWGRRWITSDTSRIALNIAKTRLMTATYPWYRLVDVVGQDVRHGFDYETVPHVTLKSIANNEPPDTETLYDQPKKDSKKLRVAGPFTVETLQADEPLAPDQLATSEHDIDTSQRFIDRIFEHLRSAGVKNGAKGETAVFTRVDLINDPDGALHAEGWYDTAAGERKAYFHIGPQFGTVNRTAVNAAIRACARRGDADWLLALGFGFESDIENRSVTRKVGSFEITKVRMHDDLMQDGLIKKDKKAASFVTIGEPDIGLVYRGSEVQVEIRGLDIYDPIRDEVKPRSAADISYWMLDEHYDGSNFTPTQVFFCGGDKDEFDKFKRGLSSLAAASVKKNAERMLKIELDDEAFERVYGFRSHPVAVEKGRKLAVRVISQFGEESTKVLTL